MQNPPPTETGPGGYIKGTPYNTQAGKVAAANSTPCIVGGVIYQQTWFATGMENPYPTEEQNAEAIAAANKVIGNA